ncbi:hypothetical protein HDU98_009507, partial [Podochytrium sp. JEL0797]
YLEELNPNASLASLASLHICADKYQLLDLAHLTSTLLSTSLTPSNAPAFLFHHAYKHEGMYDLAVKFVVDRWEEVRACDEFVAVVRKPWECEGWAWCAVWERVLGELKGCGFGRREVVPEESGAVNEFLDPTEDCEEGGDGEEEVGEDDGMGETLLRVRIPVDKSGVGESGEEEMVSARDGWKSDVDEFLDPVLDMVEVLNLD